MGNAHPQVEPLEGVHWLSSSF